MHEVPLRVPHHRLRPLHNAEAYRLATEAALLLVLIQSGCLGIKTVVRDPFDAPNNTVSRP